MIRDQPVMRCLWAAPLSVFLTGACVATTPLDTSPDAVPISTDPVISQTTSPLPNGAPPVTTSAPCWFPEDGRGCAPMVSTSGVDPSGDPVDLTGVVRLRLATSTGPGTRYARLVSVIGGCDTSTTPVVRDGNIWFPDLDGRVTATNGCVAGAAPEAWISDLFDHPFTVNESGPDTVQIRPATADVPNMDFAWEQ